ncbi:hypothetical protein PSHT_08396 [Puccinia striiformis]|uniref:Uncharacterized protein n=1 Tax=Puccinia striiformis TaxID=27350 RepID=A0A2S4VPM1_9BASI|nr:hypothetical protein PSHT_08396 [Puccinia striiformis]
MLLRKPAKQRCQLRRRFCDCCIPVVGCFTLYGCVAWLRDHIKSHCCTGIPGDTSTLATAPKF